MGRFEKTLDFFFENCLDFDSGLAGMIGELFAIEKLGMVKAPKGTPGYDGWINGRRVSVKTRQPTIVPLSGQYAGVRSRHVGMADDLLSISIKEDRTIEYRLAPFEDWHYSITKDGREYRYKLDKMQPRIWSEHSE